MSDYDYGGRTPYANTPEKYPQGVGDAYNGEYHGFIYNPYSNQYEPDPKAQGQFYEDSGLDNPYDKPKKPGLGEFIAPIAAAAGTYAGAQALTNPSTLHEIGGIFGLGGKPAAGATTGSQAAQTAASSAAPSVAAQAAPGAAPFGGFAAPTGGEASFGGLTVPTTGAESGAAYSAPGAFAPGGAALQAGGIAAGAATGYEQLKGAENLVKGKKPSLLEGAAMFPVDFGVGLAANLFGFGHSKDYADGKTRQKMLSHIGSLDAPTSSGENYSVTPEQFRKDPTTYNYDQSSPSMQEDIGAAQALSFVKGGKEPGEKGFNDLTGLFANAHKSGVSTQDLFQHYGESYDSARQKIQESELQQQVKDTLFNGLDQSFHVNAYANGGGVVSTGGNPANASSPSSNFPGAKSASSGGPVRKSPGIWQDAKGEYLSKSGQRGK